MKKNIWHFWEWAGRHGKKRFVMGWMLFGLYLAVGMACHTYFFRNELEWPRFIFSIIFNPIFGYFIGLIIWNYMEKRRSRTHPDRTNDTPSAH